MDFIKKLLQKKKTETPSSSSLKGEKSEADSISESKQILTSPDKVVDVYNSLRRQGKPIPGIVEEKMGNLCRDLHQKDVALSHYERAAEAYSLSQAWSESVRVVHKVENIFGKLTNSLVLSELRVALGRVNSEEAVQSLRKFENTLLGTSDAVVIESIISLVQAYPEVDTSVDIALAQLLASVGRPSLAIKVLDFAKRKAVSKGEPQVLAQVEEMIGLSEEKEDDLLAHINYTAAPIRKAPVKNVPVQQEESSAALPDISSVLPAANIESRIDIKGDDGRAEGRSDDDVVKELIRQLKAGISNEISLDDVQSHYDLGLAFLEMGLYEDAIESLQTAFKSPDFRMKVVQVLSRAWNETGAPFLSARLLDEVLSQTNEPDPSYLGLLYWRARTHELMGETTQAKEIYTKVALQNANFEDVMQRLREIS